MALCAVKGGRATKYNTTDDKGDCPFWRKELPYHRPCYVCGLSIPRKMRPACPYYEMRERALKAEAKEDTP